VEPDYRLEVIAGLKSSQLRKEFESTPGKFKTREIGIDRVTSEIRDLSERPGYCPVIRIFQIKEVESKLFWVYAECIYTSNTVLNAFEKFLRENMVSVSAKGFEDVPEECSRLFKTPFTQIPVDIARRTAVVSLPGKEKIVIAQDRLKGVDFDSSCTLEMITPEVLFNKLEEIEKAGNFTVVIEKVRGGIKTESGGIKTELIRAFEYRHGNENVTVRHFVFRSKTAN